MNLFDHIKASVDAHKSNLTNTWDKLIDPAVKQFLLESPYGEERADPAASEGSLTQPEIDAILNPEPDHVDEPADLVLEPVESNGDGAGDGSSEATA